MAQYKGKPAVVPMAAGDIVAKFSDLTALQPRLDMLTEEQRQKIGDISFTPDSIALQTQQVGKLCFRRTELSESAITFQAEGSPIPLKLKAELKPEGASTEVIATIDVDLPMMLKPMLSGPLQKAADQFGDVLGKLL